MFRAAVREAMQYTRPLLTFVRYLDHSTSCHLNPFVVVNEAGWSLTAAHVLSIQSTYEAHQPLIAAYEREVQAIRSRPNLSEFERQRLIGAVEHDDKWILNWAVVFSDSRVAVTQSHLWPAADLALLKLTNVHLLRVASHPLWPAEHDDIPGVTVCRIGYPFLEYEVTFDAAAGRFDASKIPPQSAIFANDGIIARYVRQEVAGSAEGISWFETSFPGLIGQSGGPVFDHHGVVHGLHTGTTHYDLGFDATLRLGQREVSERQFLNVGRAVHARTIAQFFDQHDITYYVPDDDDPA